MEAYNFDLKFKQSCLLIPDILSFYNLQARITPEQFYRDSQ